MLPELIGQGELPPGVHRAGWEEFQGRFCDSAPRRVWLSARLRALLDLAGATGELRRVFIWGSFVTAKPAPRDLDILLIMSEDFEVDRLSAPAQAVFDSTRAKAPRKNNFHSLPGVAQAFSLLRRHSCRRSLPQAARAPRRISARQAESLTPLSGIIA